MKKYAISVVVVLAVLAVTWSAFAQAQDRAGQREGMRERMANMSEEERTKFREQMRARFENMSEEERAKARQEMQQRGGGSRRGGSRRGGFMNAEDQQKAIKAIEVQLAKLKASAAQMPTPPQGGYQDMSDDERAKLRETMTKVMQTRQSALQAIMAQVAALQGRRQPAAEGARYIILSTDDLRPIQEAATKEKAEETGKLLQGLLSRGPGRGFGGGRPGGSRPQGGGERGSREGGGSRRGGRGVQQR